MTAPFPQAENVEIIPAGPLPWSAPPMGPAGAFDLIFADQFDTPSLKPVWRSGLWYPGIINSELQAYRPEQLVLGDGRLTIMAEKKPSALWWTDKTLNPWYAGSGPVMKDYASGMAQTYGTLQVARGDKGIAVEGRVRVAHGGKGFWNALWMLSVDKTLEQPRPEIDIFEILNDGRAIDESIANFNYHIAGQDPAKGIYKHEKSFGWAFHRFVVDIQPGGIIWYVDGIERHRYTGPTYPGPMHLLVNLAVGGAWPGSPNDQTPFPILMVVDYIKVWRRT